MLSSRKDKVRALLHSIETGDPGAIVVVAQERYIQHNPQTHEGSEGLEVLFKRLSKTNPRVNLVRVFEDGDYVFAHTEYDFSNSNIGFEVFRFEDEYIVEHWDNIQRRQGPNKSGRSMVDGPTEALKHADTETNRNLVKAFIEAVLIDRDLEKLSSYISAETFIQHNPKSEDGIAALRLTLERRSEGGFDVIYSQMHRILAEGNFILSVCEGFHGGIHSSFYDLYRVEQGKIVEQWNTIEKVPPRSDWKNDNGKF